MTNNSKLSLQVYNGYDDMFNKTKEESFTQDKLNNKYGQGWGTFSSSLKYAVLLLLETLFVNCPYIIRT